MADMNLYDVDFGGYQTQIKLTDEDAESYGDRARKVGSVDVAKAVPTHHGIQIKEEDGGEKKAEAPANKSRSATNKSS